MSIIDRAPMTNLQCMREAPDGSPCKYRTDDAFEMGRHQRAHNELRGHPGSWDNCTVCLHPIQVTKDVLLRVHGKPARRCSGSSTPGMFLLRCRGERDFYPTAPDAAATAPGA